MTRTLFAVLILFSSTDTIVVTPTHAGEAFRHISMTKVEQLLGKPGVFVYDINVPEIWEQYHLPGTVHVDNPDLTQFLPTDKSATLIFYCAGPLCSVSAAAAREAARLGYLRLYVMDDGIFGWVKAGKVERAKSTEKP
jgi:rhodanese-related sulfurtransferase